MPLSLTLPAVGLINWRIARPVVDFPQPLSPTSPNVSPRRTNRSTPSTAFTFATVRPNSPPLIGKCTFNPLTSMSVVSAGAEAFASCTIEFYSPLIWIEASRELLTATYRHQFGALLPAPALHLWTTSCVGTPNNLFGQIRWLPGNWR